jgi:hypothetical protein
MEDISLTQTAIGITEAANSWLQVAIWTAGLSGFVLVIAGFVYAHRRQHDPRLGLTPAVALWLCGGALIWGAYWRAALGLSLFQTDALYVYDTGGHHEWEARLILATQAVTNLIGVCIYYRGWGTLALLGLEGRPLGSGRLSRGLLRLLFGFLLIDIGLLLTAILGTFGLPSPFVAQ